MSRTTSLYLDLCRALACGTVLLGHVLQIHHHGLPWLHGATRAAVIVFFVLSGVVIAYSARRQTFMEYIVARFSRLYSVAAPAIWFSFAAGALAGEELSVRTFVLAHLFYTQSWWLILKVPMNAAFWSLCYEFWYYTAFAAWHFGRGPMRWVAVGVCLIVAGPAIGTLLPVWLLGVALVRWVTPRPSPATFWLSTGLLLALIASGAGIALRDAIKLAVPEVWFLGSAQQFPTDWLIGGLFALHLRALPTQGLALVERYSTAIRWAAARTFSVYLFHTPVVLLATPLTAALPPAVQMTVVLTLALSVSLLLAEITEIKAPRLRAWLIPRKRRTANA